MKVIYQGSEAKLVTAKGGYWLSREFGKFVKDIETGKPIVISRAKAQELHDEWKSLNGDIDHDQAVEDLVQKWKDEALEALRKIENDISFHENPKEGLEKAIHGQLKEEGRLPNQALIDFKKNAVANIREQIDRDDWISVLEALGVKKFNNPIMTIKANNIEQGIKVAGKEAIDKWLPKGMIYFYANKEIAESKQFSPIK